MPHIVKYTNNLKNLKTQARTQVFFLKNKINLKSLEKRRGYLINSHLLQVTILSLCFEQKEIVKVKSRGVIQCCFWSKLGSCFITVLFLKISEIFCLARIEACTRNFKESHKWWSINSQDISKVKPIAGTIINFWLFYS